MWFCAFRLLTEISNPFMNIRILLDMMDVKKNSYIARLNGKFFLSSFVLTRPPMIPAFWGATIYHLFKNSEQLWHFDAPSLFFWVVSGLALDYLNVIWLIKIRKGEHLKSVPVCVQFGRSYSRFISDIISHTQNHIKELRALNQQSSIAPVHLFTYGLGPINL